MRELFVEAQYDEILLDLVEPAKFLIKKAFEEDRVNLRNGRSLANSAEIKGDVAVHDIEKFIISEVGKRYILVVAMQLVLLLKMGEIIDFFPVLMVVIEARLQE